MSKARLPEVRYAEDELGYNKVLEQLKGAHEALGVAIEGNETNEQNVRSYVESVKMREDELYMLVLSDLAGASVAAQERELKTRQIQDGLLGERRGMLEEMREALRASEIEVKLAETKYKGMLAEVNLLTSYLDYLAAYKQGRNVLNATDLPTYRG